MQGISLLAIFTSFCCLTQRSWAAEGKVEHAKNDSVSVLLELPHETSKDLRVLRRKLAPKCGNFLNTVLKGRWVSKSIVNDLGWTKRNQIQRELKKREDELDEDMRFVWKKKGIPPNPWSSTTVCGYYRLRRATRLRPSIGTWCDPDGPRPCCSNILYGTCVSKDRYNGCRCSKCANVQNMNHAEVMDWKPYNNLCEWHQYTPAQACEVLEASPVKELYLVGDSFMRNMYVTMLMVLSGKPITGGWAKHFLTEKQRELCSNYGTTYWMECRNMIKSLDEMLHRDSLCGDGRNVSFKFEFKKYYSSKFQNEFKEFVRGLLGRKGSYVVVGIGFHVQMRLDYAINRYMKPAVDLVKSYYRNRKNVPAAKRWPRFLFSFPLDYGILKPTRYLRAQYITKQQAFERGMTTYCRRNSIEILDFTPLVKDVISFDGIHYGVGVNVAKSQILLNYFASLPDL